MGTPGFAAARRDGLQGLAACLEGDETAAAVTLADGTRRLSAAARSVRGVALAPTSACAGSVRAGTVQAQSHNQVGAPVRRTLSANDICGSTPK